MFKTVISSDPLFPLFRDQSWTYTADGLPQQIVTYNDAGSTTAVNRYAYNKRRMLLNEHSEQVGWYSWPISYGYDANGHLASQTSVTGATIAYAPNALGQATQADIFATNASYFPNGALKQFTYGNGIVHTLTQNARGLPERSRDAYGATAVHDDSVDFDQNGNVAAISDGLPGQRGNRTMTYDGLDRLTDVASPMYGTTGAHYSYDVLDNLKTVVAPGRNHSYVYDGYNRLTNVMSGGASVIGLGYDAQGNLANKNGQVYSFDFGNRLRGVAGQESYRYDGHGRRILAWSSTLGSILSQYSRSGQLTFQQNQREATNIHYVYLAGSLVARYEHNYATNVYSTRYQHTDALGTPVAVTDANRNVVRRSEYEPFGKLLNRPMTDGPGYTGHVEDAATGLVYMQQRYYDPGVGRFLSVDPVTATSVGGNFNRYWYANNNPYKFKDPDGRRTCSGVRTTCPMDVSSGTRSSGPAGDLRGAPRGGNGISIQKPLTNPSGGGIRSDSQGDGNFGSPRGPTRDHAGIDLETTTGQDIVSPADGTAINFIGSSTGYPIVDITPSDPSLGIELIRMLYIDALTGTRAWTPYPVTAGETVVGTSANLQGLGYSLGVTPHVHLQVKVGGVWVNPIDYMEVPKE